MADRAEVTAEDYASYDARVAAGEGPHPCLEGWFWIAASLDVLEPLTAAEVQIARARSRQP